MAQNEMKAKPALPERVRSMEGLGRILWRCDGQQQLKVQRDLRARCSCLYGSVADDGIDDRWKKEYD